VSINFLQTKEWSDFWINANSDNHKTYYIELATLPSVNFIIYQYPWKFKQVWLYIPRLGSEFNIKDSKTAENIFQEIVKKIVDIRNSTGATLAKIDFDSEFYNLLKGQTEITEHLSKISNQQIVTSPRKINYLSTILLNIANITLPKNSNIESINTEKLVKFFADNNAFWSTTNQNIRRYTKKSIQQNWKIEVDSLNFEEWYEVHKATAERQKFATHSKYYLEQLYKQSFTTSIILKNQENIAQAVWLGGIFGDTFVYLHGGNTDKSFKNYGQYLIHLMAIYIARMKGCTKYDLGGYEDDKGFSKFKSGYRGELISFPGAFDIVLKEPDYFLTRISQWLKR
jgi:hypothetical protein